MAEAANIIRWAVGLGFVALGAMTVRAWIRSHDRSHGHLALAVGILGVVAVLDRIQDVSGYRLQPVGDATFVAFIASGYALFLFRQSLLPVSRRAQRLAALASAAAVAGVLAVRVPHDGAPRFTAAQEGALIAMIATWSVLVGASTVRFWTVARGRPPVQRGRLRALSLAYAGIIAATTASLSAPRGEPVAMALVVTLITAAVAPLMLVGVAPPRWLRRAWRAREEEELRSAIAELVHVTIDPRELAERALPGALRLLGADAGLIVDGGRNVLAQIGLTPDERAELALRLPGAPEIIPVAGDPGRPAVVVPLALEGGVGVLAVLSGPFTPVFGTDEVELLAHYGRSVTAAIGRACGRAELSREKARVDVLLEAVGQMGEGLIVVDGPEIVYANDALSRINGYTLEELRALGSFFDIVVTEDRERIISQFRRRLAGEEVPDHYETAIIHKDGHRVQLEVAVKVMLMGGRTQVVALCRDITERKRAFDSERKRADQLTALAEASRHLAGNLEPDVLVTTIAASARKAVGSERAALAVLSDGELDEFLADGITADELRRAGALVGTNGYLASLIPQGRTIRTTVGIGLPSPGSAEIGSLMIVPVVRGGALTGVLYFAGKEGSSGFEEADDAVAASFAAFAGDAMEAARTFQRERALVARLQELDELKNAFLTAVSHELRTPLTSVIGFAGTLQLDRGRFSLEERADMTKRIVVNAQKLERLLADLLDIDRLHRGILRPALRPTDLAQLALRVVQEFDTNRLIKTEVEPVVVEVDAPKVERIVENLLANAVRYTVEGTQIWVKVRPEPGGALIAVEDAGPGIPPAAREEIFDPFRRGPSMEHAPGVGIGLSLVARFAEMHGGRAWVEEREGGGASFRVSLPATGGQAPRPRTKARATRTG